MTVSSVSIVLRVKNEGKALGQVLAGITSQTGAPEPQVIVVDSGSTDDTLAIAARHGAEILEIPPEEFTWGGAINRGFGAARGEIGVLLSGHCTPVDEHWLADLIAPFDDPTVAATSSRHVPDLAIDPCEAVELLEDFPAGEEPRESGPYSNAAGAVRLSVWQSIRFDETLVSNEDGEWAQRVRAAGHRIVHCPASRVVHSHPPNVDVVYRRLFWRALTGVQLYPGCRDGQRLYQCYRYCKYLLRDWGMLWRDRRPWAIWRAVFYEWVRQAGRFRGARMAGKLGTDSQYAGLQIPAGLRRLDWILRGLERPGRSHIHE